MSETRIPIIRFRGYLIVSVQIELTDRIVVQLKADITRTVETSAVKGLILDLTGIDFMDSYISRAIRDIGVMTRLMGVPTVVCGMNPAIAMTMVEMGIELKSVPMALNLDAAMSMFEANVAEQRLVDDVVVVTEEDEEHVEVVD